MAQQRNHPKCEHEHLYWNLQKRQRTEHGSAHLWFPSSQGKLCKSDRDAPERCLASSQLLVYASKLALTDACLLCWITGFTVGRFSFLVVLLILHHVTALWYEGHCEVVHLFVLIYMHNLFAFLLLEICSCYIAVAGLFLLPVVDDFVLKWTKICLDERLESPCPSNPMCPLMGLEIIWGLYGLVYIWKCLQEQSWETVADRTLSCTEHSWQIVLSLFAFLQGWVWCGSHYS